MPIFYSYKKKHFNRYWRFWQSSFHNIDNFISVVYVVIFENIEHKISFKLSKITCIDQYYFILILICRLALLSTHFQNIIVCKNIKDCNKLGNFHRDTSFDLEIDDQ